MTTLQAAPAITSSRQRVLDALAHKQPDQVPLDFGATAVTGIHVSCVAALRDYHGLEQRPVKVHEPFQMLGLLDEDLKQVLGIDVDGVFRRRTIFVFNSIHNIQASTPTENIVAMFDAVREFNGRK